MARSWLIAYRISRIAYRISRIAYRISRIDSSATGLLDHSTTRPLDYSTTRPLDYSTTRPPDYELPDHKRRIFRDFSGKPLGDEAHLQLQAAPVRRLIFEGRMLHLGVQSLLELGQENAPRRIAQAERAQLLDEVVALDHAVVHQGEHDRVGDDRSKLLHDVERHRRLAVLRRMQEADVRIQPDDVHRSHRLVHEQRVGVAQQRVDRVGRRAADALAESPLVVEQLLEDAEVGRRRRAFQAKQPALRRVSLRMA